MQKNELLVFGPALKFPVLLNRYPVFDSVQSLSQGAHDSRSQSVSGLYSNISSGGSSRSISVPSFSTNRTAPSGSTIFVAGQRSGGKLASIALIYCGERQLQHARSRCVGSSITRKMVGANLLKRSP